MYRTYRHQSRAFRIGCLITAIVFAGTVCGFEGSSSAATKSPTTITIAANQAPTSLNPMLNGNNVDAAYYQILPYASLIHLAPNGSLQPGLAVSWNLNKTDTILDLRLRPGVRFSDGTHMTAADVVQSLNDFRRASGADVQYTNVFKSVTATGPLTVKISLKSPDPDAPLVLTERLGAGSPISLKALAKPATLSYETDGAGPYMLDRSLTTPGETYTFVPNPYYYDKKAIHFKKFIIRVITDPSTALEALQSGQVAFEDGEYANAAEAKADGLTVEPVLSNWFGVYLFDRNSGPLGSLLVRQALNYATNRQAITQTVLLGYGHPTDEVELPANSDQGYDPAYNSYYSYNVTKAKQLLKKAGYPHGFTLVMGAATTWHNGGQMAQAIASEWAKVGVKVDIKLYPTTDQMDAPWGARELPSIAGGFGVQPMLIEEPQLLAPDAGLFNPYKSQNTVLTALIDRAKSATTEATSQKAWDAVEDEIVKLAWFVPTTAADTIYFGAKSLRGDTVSPKSYAPNPLEFYWAGSN